jgi:hypothetical protein
VKPRCVCGCGQRSVHRHHAVYRQELRKHGGDPNDPRNLVPVAFDCHGAHHSGAKRLLLSMLPDSVYEFAGEVLGEAAPGYLARYYRGDDPRLDALSA